MATDLAPRILPPQPRRSTETRRRAAQAHWARRRAAESHAAAPSVPPPSYHVEYRLDGRVVAQLGLLERAARHHTSLSPYVTALRLRRILATLRVPLRVNGHDAVVDASVGIGVSGPRLHDPADLLRAADTALYRAEAAGRGLAVLFETGMYADAVVQLDRETDLRGAIEQGQLRLEFQPEIDLATGRIVALEALARWDRPHHGPVAPEDFIPVAEESGLTLLLGEWVLREACRRACA